MEVNLAVFIMAAGVLAMVSLYPLGYRENQQSVDDVKAAAYADSVFNQIAAALSARSLTWDEWKGCVREAVSKTNSSFEGSGGNDRGWGSFCDSSKGFVPKDRSTINGISREVFQALTRHAGKAGFSPDGSALNEKNLTVALVAQWGCMRLGNGNYSDDYSRVTLSMRVARNSGALFAQPIFLTEIHFQGDQEDTSR